MSKSDKFDKVPRGINPAAVRVIKARGEKIVLVEDGLLPRTSELFSGYPFAGGSIDVDITAWCRSRLLLGGTERLVSALENLEVSHTAQACWHVIDADDGQLESEVDRVLLYATCLRDHKAAERMLFEMRDRVGMTDARSFNALISRMVAEGFSTMCKSPDEAFERGYRRVREMTSIAGDFFTAQTWIVAGSPADAEVRTADAIIREALDEADEDRAETMVGTLPGIVVVPRLPASVTLHRKELQRAWTGIDGNRIPLVAKGDVVTARESLVARWPHAAEIVDVILGDLAATETVRFRPTCIVGEPGSGKTALCKAIAEAVGIPVEVMPLGGVADASLMGTSAQWSSARESVPLQLIRRSGCANPAMVWDEVEKVSTSSHLGCPLDALLPMLERTQSKRVRDPALEVECDLSMVSHFATANTLEGIPSPLRDRMRILQMPNPEWRHLGALTENIMCDLMLQRGLDGRWTTPLAQDEMEIIRQAWPGGSLRQLTRIVETLVDGREVLWGRA